MGIGDSVESTARWMIARDKRNGEAGFKCGQCAAYECFRNYPENWPAGLCFQEVRQCKQECINYSSNSQSCSDGGICKVDKRQVDYQEECHIDSVKKSRL